MFLNASRKSRLKYAYISGLRVELKYPIQKSTATTISGQGQAGPQSDVMTYLFVVGKRKVWITFKLLTHYTNHRKNGNQQRRKTPIIIPNVLAALCSALQPLVGRTDPPAKILILCLNMYIIFWTIPVYRFY